METEIGNAEINAHFYNALDELFKRGKLHKHFKDDYQTIENLCLFLRLILDNIEKVTMKSTQFCHLTSDFRSCQKHNVSKSTEITGMLIFWRNARKPNG